MTCLRMPRTRVLLAARAVMWFGVVAHDAVPCRGDSRWKATCLQSTSVPPARPHSTPTAQRDEESVPSATVLVPTPTEKNSLHHRGSRSHDDVDTDTESKCDSRCASLENQVLCVAVITKAEGHKNSQRYTFFCNKRRRCTSGMSPFHGRRIPSRGDHAQY